jgi:hypothetical protein
LSAAPHAPKESCQGPGASERQHESSGGRTPARRWRDRLAQRRRAAGHLHDPEHVTGPARLPVLDVHLAALAPHDGLGAARGVGVVGTGCDAPSPAPQGAPPSPTGLTLEAAHPGDTSGHCLVQALEPGPRRRARHVRGLRCLRIRLGDGEVSVREVTSGLDRRRRQPGQCDASRPSGPGRLRFGVPLALALAGHSIRTSLPKL